MRKLVYLFIGSLLLSCSAEETPSNGDKRIDLLYDGKWVVSEFEGEKNRLGIGVVFSPDKQFFNLDSQGRVVPTHHKIIFDLKSDTLQVVDFKYEQKYIKEKGTLVFIVEKLNENSLKLNSIHPDTTSTYELKKEDL